MANAADTGLQDYLDTSRVKFLRGDTRHENLYYQRMSLIGDIFNSTPILGSKSHLLVSVAGRLDGGSGSYREFAAVQDRRDDLVYVAPTTACCMTSKAKVGVETFAYIPTLVIPGPHVRTDRRYTGEAAGQRR